MEENVVLLDISTEQTTQINSLERGVMSLAFNTVCLSTYFAVSFGSQILTLFSCLFNGSLGFE